MKKHVNKGVNSRGGTAKTVCIIIIALLLCIYAGGVFYFHSRFLPRTQVNGIPCGGKKVALLQKEIEEEANTYVLQINGRNELSDFISADEIVLEPVFDDALDQILVSQSPLLWPINVWSKHLYETSTVVQYDENAFDKKLNALVFMKEKNQKKPVDAYISDITENGYEIIPEDVGSVILKEKLREAVSEAVLTLSDTLDLNEEGCYLEASVKSDDAKLVQECAKLNQLVLTRVEYQFGDETVVTTPEVIAGWLVYDDKGNISFEEDKVREFINDMARKYDTFGKRRTFVTHTGDTIDITEGTYGWWMNRPEETKELMERIRKGESGVKTPVYYATAAQYGQKDWGDTYVEIDLTEQHVYVYVEGELAFESDCVSGNVSRGHATPRGIYGITYKERNATLVGQGYNSAVSYWMPFNNNVGMHDASWRKAFGGEIYLTNGSHGCINLPKESAERIFELVSQNTPVIVYGGKTPPPKKEEAEQPTTDVTTEENTTTENILPQTPEIPETSNTEVPNVETTPDIDNNGTGVPVEGQNVENTVQNISGIE